MSFLIRNATLINEGKRFTAHLLTNGQYIQKIISAEDNPDFTVQNAEVIEADGLWLLPGVIDDQVHFREPGLTHKGTFASESAAAAAGGITSVMEMPNTIPFADSIEKINQKIEIADKSSFVNYAFFLGATNDNINEVKKADHSNVCGIKLFMGSSTGNMLVDDKKTLERIFAETPVLLAIHSEDETIIKNNLASFREKFNDDIPTSAHPLIRSAEACYVCTSRAIELANRFQTRLHVLHLSTAREADLFEKKSLSEKRITTEVCVHHLWFDDSFYNSLGTHIKWNPAIKSSADRDALRAALLDGRIDIVATDHAPHTLAEKDQTYLKAPSGGPLVQHALPAMLTMAEQGIFTAEQVVDKMCHAPALCYKIKKRGFLREGYFADFVLVNPNALQTVEKSNLLYHCGWSPFEGITFHSEITATFVNGNRVYTNGEPLQKGHTMKLEFES
ncbi:MAG: dihydroorotase [Bacteroidota bacterium]